MKVAFINIDDSLGGASIACVRLVNALNKYSIVEATLFVQEKTEENKSIVNINSGIFHKIKNKIRFIYERLFFLRLEKDKKIRFLFSPAKIGIDLTEKIDFSKFDIIHLHWVNFGFQSLNSLKRLFELNIPIVWTLHDMWPFTGGCHYSGTCNNFQSNCGNCVKFLKNYSVNDLSHRIFLEKSNIYKGKNLSFVGCSKWIAGLAKKSNLVSNENITNIPNPINTDIFKPLDRHKTRLKYGLKMDKNYVLFLAMNPRDERKGFRFFDAAIGLLLKEYIDFEILLVGEVDELKWNNIIKLPKTKNQAILNEYYNLANVFVAPSIEDNLPNTIVEATASGTPTVAFNLGGIPEIINHKKTGFLAVSSDSQDLANGILWCFENYNSSLIQNCRDMCLEKFSENIISKAYQDLYTSIVNGNKL